MKKQTSMPKSMQKEKKDLLGLLQKLLDIIFVDEEIHTFDDSNALTDDEIVDLAILDAATNILYDQYQGSDILDTEDMTEFSKREKRWSLRRSFKKRIHEAVGALFG
uniref:Uncharacterized protein n=1 Tax=Panagrolaimus superbus TaxID=310955 RepID=A0A914XZC0_9BILA